MIRAISLEHAERRETWAEAALAVGEALVSFLDTAGVPVPVERVRVNRPATSMAPISDLEREAIMLSDPMRHRYAGDEAEMRQAFARRWRAERGLPALPEAAEPYREGEWANYLPDFSGAAPRGALMVERARQWRADGWLLLDRGQNPYLNGLDPREKSAPIGALFRGMTWPYIGPLARRRWRKQSAVHAR